MADPDPSATPPKTLEERVVRVLYFLFLGHQLIVPIAAYWFITHDFETGDRLRAIFVGFFPALVLLGMTPVIVSMPGNLVRAATVTLLVPLELLAQVLLFDGGISAYFVEAFAVELLAASLAIIVMALHDRAALRIILTCLGISSMGLVMVYSPLAALYEGAHWAYWVMVAISILSGAWAFQQVLAEDGPFKALSMRTGPVSRWAEKTFLERFPRVRIKNLDTTASGAVIVGLALWILIPSLGK